MKKKVRKKDEEFWQKLVELFESNEKEKSESLI